MLKSFSLNNWLASWRQLSPSVLLFSIALHGVLLALPISLLSQPKSQPSKQAAEEKEALNLLSLSPNLQPTGDFFSPGKMLVAPKISAKKSLPQGNSLIVSQLPPLPPALESKATKTILPPPPPTAIIQTPPLSPKIEVTKTPRVFTITKKPVLKSTKKSVYRPSQRLITVPMANVAKNTNAKANSVDVVSAKPNELIVQTSDWLIETSEKEVFDATFISLGKELSLIEDFNFAQPEKFTISIPGIEKIFGTAVGKTPDELAVLVNSKLEAQGFKVSQISTYGGGPLYEVKKGSFTQYINIAPSADEKGAIIIAWETVPILLNSY
jgi:hypothetical protein